jgi:aminoglycoside phosphotransferase (APT) family kinase protein
MVGMEARLASVLVGGEPSITVIGAMRYERAYANDLWFFDSDAGPLVAKLRRIPEEDPEQLRAYARSMDRLRDAGFPTPELLLLEDESDALDGRQFSVLRYAPGEVAAANVRTLSESSRARFFHDLGRTIGRLHAIDLPRSTGWRDDAGIAHPGWPEVVAAGLDDVRAELADLTGEERRMIDIAAKRIERDAASLLPAVVEPRLVHRDLHLGNVLMQGDSVTAVIDFEMVREWDAAYDFVKINTNILTPFPDSTDPFLAGYREQALPDGDFESRVHLYQGLYGLLSAAEFLAGNDGHRHWFNHLRRWLQE